MMHMMQMLHMFFAFFKNLKSSFSADNMPVYALDVFIECATNIARIITQPSIYGVIVYFWLCHEALNYSTSQ